MARRLFFSSFVRLFGLLCLLPCAAESQIIGSAKLFGRYRQFVWQDQHGLPQNGISRIVKTPDGYLWLAIAEGVARFDGVRFTAFDTGNTPEIKSNNVQSLLADRAGTLWIGTHGGGVTIYRDGRFTNYSIAEGLTDTHVRSLFEDRHGNVWVGTDGGGLHLFRDGKFTIYSTADGLPDNRVGAIGEDAAGALWVGTSNGLARFVNGRFETFTTRDGLAGNLVAAIHRDRRGDLWIGSTSGLNVFRDERFTIVGGRDGFTGDDVKSIAEDADGALWFGTDDGGLHRLKDGRFEQITTREGLINNNIQAIFADEETGDVWLGTSGGGLAQLRAGKFNVYTTSDGLADEMVGAIYEDRAGAVWVGTDEGLCRYKDGKFTVLKAPDGKSLRGVSGISQDRAGNLWISGGKETGDKVLKFNEENSRIEIVRDNFYDNRASVVLHDRDGSDWFGTSYDGLHRIDRSGRETVYHKTDGLADEYVNALYEDRAGGIWIGTRNGLSRYKDGALTTWNAAGGFAGKHILSFYEDRSGTLWVGTHGDGLFRFKDGAFKSVTTKDGLYDNLAFQILEDGRGNLWMSGNKGIYRASLAELEELADGRRALINSFAYGSADGMLSRECNGANPAGIRARDGRLWFPTIKGVVVIDPNVMETRPPNVAIERTIIDSQTVPAGQPVEIQPNQENLEIQFAALSWNRPQQIRFKYRLVGLDEDWVEAGTRRTAYYAHLPPGEYTFQVTADNGEGVWNADGQRLCVRVLPSFYQTWWFFAACALASALLVRFVYGYRLAQLKKINEARTYFTQQLIENQEAERRRIAVELHDSIGQSLIVIRNRALISLTAPEKHERVIEQMREISESAADSIKEVREISHNLHPYQLEHLGLTTALETMIESVEAATEIQFESRIDDVDDVLTKDAEINLYRIVQESLNNVVKHSNAARADVSLRKTNGFLNLSIEDDGKGFSVEAAKDKRGLGLTGIRERAKMLNAEYEIHSFEGRGTTINLRMNLENQ